MTRRYIVMHVVDVHENAFVIAGGRMADPELAYAINSTQEALEAIYAPGVVPLDHGFETVSCIVEDVGEIKP